MDAAELARRYQAGERDFQKVDLAGADLPIAQLRGANLCDADLRGATLTGACLRDANLRRSDLTGARLQDADLGGADLTSASLFCADLRGANLQGANLTWADLTGADLHEATLLGANAGDIYLNGPVWRRSDIVSAARGETWSGSAPLQESLLQIEPIARIGTREEAKSSDRTLADEMTTGPLVEGTVSSVGRQASDYSEARIADTVEPHWARASGSVGGCLLLTSSISGSLCMVAWLLASIVRLDQAGNQVAVIPEAVPALYLLAGAAILAGVLGGAALGVKAFGMKGVSRVEALKFTFASALLPLRYVIGAFQGMIALAACLLLLFPWGSVWWAVGVFVVLSVLQGLISLAIRLLGGPGAMTDVAQAEQESHLR